MGRWFERRWIGFPAIAVWVAIFIVDSLSCSADERPPLTIESKHFRVHAYPDDFICPRLGEQLEDHYAAVSGYLGMRLAPEKKIDVYKFRDEDDLKAHGSCADSAHACAGEGEVDTATVTSLPFEHELVHAYAGTDGEAPLLFEEGLATMLQDADGLGVGERPPSFADTELEALFESDAWRSAADPPYAAAASFTRSLVDRHGIAAFRKFHGMTSRDADLPAIDESFAIAFGESLADALSAWRQGPAGSGWLPVAACAADAIESGEPTVLGPLVCGRQQRSLALAQPATVVVRTRHDRAVGAFVRPCSGERPIWPAEWSVSTTHPDEGQQRELWASLPAGSYYLEASAYDPGASAATPLVAIDWSPPLADRCDDAWERLIVADTRRVSVPLAFEPLADDGGDAGLRDAFVRFELEVPERLSVAVEPPDILAGSVFGDEAEHRTKIWMCDAACSVASCTPIEGAVDLPAGESRSLMLEGAPSDRRTFQISLEPTQGG